ncbi:hypothetical protein SLA2020_030290 [Shorea laevis]
MGRMLRAYPGLTTWVEGMPVAEAEPSSTPPSQPAAVEPEHDPARTTQTALLQPLHPQPVHLALQLHQLMLLLPST